MKKLWIYFLVFLPATLLGQVQFVAQASKYKVGVGERFSVSFSLNADAGNFQYPNFQGFTIVAGPSSQHSTSIINGRMSVQKAASFELMALKTGTFTIGQAKVVVDGQEYVTKPLTIQVVEGQAIVPDSPEDKARKLAYIKILTSKKQVYVGEPIPVRYVLYLKTNIGNYTAVEEPDLQGFIRNDLDGNGTSRKTEIIDGEQVAVYDIGQFVLIPQRAGTFKPGQLMLQMPTAVPTGRRDWFGNPETQTVNQVATATFPTIEVQALPDMGKPTGFSGAVGDFKITANLSRNEVKANESITLTIELAGTGNLQTAEIPIPEIPGSIERYDPKYKENISTTLQGVKGNKRNEYLLIPRNKGAYKVPAMRFSFFNTQKGQYETITTQEMTITVTDGPAAISGGGSDLPPATDKSAVAAVGEDILFINTNPGAFVLPRKPFFGSMAFLAINTAAASCLLLLPVFYRMKKSYKPDTLGTAKKQAAKASRKILKSAAIHLREQNSKEFYAALHVAFQRFFKDKFGLQAADFTIENVAQILATRGAEAEVVARIEQLLKRADMARFAPANPAALQTDYDEAMQCIYKMEVLK